MVNTRLYKEMTKILNEKECSKRQLAKECDISYLTFVQFFNPNMIWKPFSQKLKSKLHNHLGISYDIIDEYNEKVLKERGK